LDVESYSSTFGPKNTRKRPKVAASDYSELLKRVESTQETYKEGADRNIKVEQEYKEQQGDAVLTAGQSNRIHNELHKVIDASDVLIQVLDARDPEGTRSRWLEKYLRKEHPHKHLVLLLNKCDLVPQKVTKQWLSQFSREYPCLAFHASLQRPFGKGALIQILRQFQQLHAKDKQQISVGFVGYPNVGKSSVINTLRHKKVCNVAPLPGETKVWQYITLFKRVFLIDCPGVVTAVDVAKHNTVLEDQYQQLHQGHEDDETRDQARDQPGTNVVSEKEAALVLKGVVRIENLTDPVSYIGPLLTRVNLEYMQRVYQCEVSTNHVTFLETLAKKMGKLLKGGHPDITRVSRIVLNDWLRGKIPFYNKPSGTRDTVRSSDAEQLRAPSQLIENIPVKEEFKELFHEEFEDDEAADEGAQGDAAEDEELSAQDASDSKDEEDEAPVDWDAVYASVNPEQDFNTIHQHENDGAKNSSVGLPKTADLPKLELQAPLAEDAEASARGRARGQPKVAGKEKKQRGKLKKKSQVKSEDEMKSLLRTLESIEGTANLHGTQQYKNRNNNQNKKKRARSEQTEDFEIVPQDSRAKRRKLTPK
jgi:nuclear GTP-binding protein